MVMSKFWYVYQHQKMTIIIQGVESKGRSGGRKFPAVGFAGKKSPDLAFSNVDRYELWHCLI